MVDGLKACGIDPQGAEFTGAGPKFNTPLNFLISQQLGERGVPVPDLGQHAPNIYASQDAIRALGSGGFTATPPTPKSGPQWKGVTEFATGASGNHLAGADRRRRRLGAEGLLGQPGAESDDDDAGDGAERRRRRRPPRPAA